MSRKPSYETLYVKVYRQFLKDIGKSIRDKNEVMFRSLIHEFTEYNLSVSFFLRSIFENDWYEFDFKLNLCPDECFWKSASGKCECSGFCPYYSLHSRMQYLSIHNEKDLSSIPKFEVVDQELLDRINSQWWLSQNEKKKIEPASKSQKFQKRSRHKTSELRSESDERRN